MISSGNRYVVNIVDRIFVNDSGFSFPQTAIITIYDENQSNIFSSDYGYLPTEKIYDMIEQKVELNFDNCYISNFSITAYRRSRILHKTGIQELPGFSAKFAFFNSKYQVDFSFVDFGDYNVIFHGAYFSNGLVTFHSSKFGIGTIDFNSSIFRNGNFDFSNVTKKNGDINFKNVLFAKGEKNFQDTDFGIGNKSFSNTDFGGGEIKFINTRFNDGKTSFKLTNFGDGEVDFHFSTFGNGFLSFENARFGNGSIDFSKVDFGYSKVNFNRAIFENGDINFEGSELKKNKFTIKWVDFGSGNINFERAEMSTVEVSFDKANFDRGSTSRVSFNRSKFKSLSLRSCHLDDYFDLRVSKCEVIDLSNTIVRDIVDLKTYDYKMEIDILNMSHMRLLGMIDIDWHINNVPALIKNQPNSTNWNKAEQFRILKENFNKNGRYSDEDKAYIEFKRFEQKAILEERIAETPYSALWEYPYYWFKLLVFDKIGLYATEPLRVMCSMAVFYLIFSCLYIVLSFTGLGDIVPSIGGHEQLSVYGRAFYFGAITFFTIGYGDFYPVGIFRWISSIEGFVGVFLMSYFTVAFVRKILR